MKVCLLSRFFTTDKREGVGIGRVSGRLLKGLHESGIEVYPIYTQGSGLFSYFWYTYMGIPLKVFKADVYHALTPMEGIWIPKDKSVCTFHDLFQVTNPELVGGGMGYNSFKLEFGRRYFEWACRKASQCKRIVCVSEKTREEVVKYLGVNEDRVRGIKSGISNNLDYIGKVAGDKGFRIGYLGMLDKRKRVDLLVKAFRETSIDATLCIVGRGLDEALLRTLAGTDKRIEFHGHIEDSELSWFYNSIDVFVFPSSIEGYGLPIVEAMACKTPVVVMEDALIPEEVKSRCIKSRHLKETLELLYEGKGIAEYYNIEENYRWAKAHSWENTIKEYIKVYKEVLGG